MGGTVLLGPQLAQTFGTDGRIVLVGPMGQQYLTKTAWLYLSYQKLMRMILTMRTSGLDLETHQTHGGLDQGVIAIPLVFRRPKGDCINLSFQFIISDSLLYLE